MDLVEKTLLVGVLQNHAKLVPVPKAAIHLENVRMVHEELQLDLLNNLRLHLLLLDLLQVHQLERVDEASAPLLNHMHRPKSALPQLPPHSKAIQGQLLLLCPLLDRLLAMTHNLSILVIINLPLLIFILITNHILFVHNTILSIYLLDCIIHLLLRVTLDHKISYAGIDRFVHLGFIRRL